MSKIQYTNLSFRKKSLDLIEIINNVIDDYSSQGFRLTLRQVYYQLVARDYIPNSERSYKNIGNLISNARLAGYIDWYAIEDRTRGMRSNSHWNKPEDVIQSAKWSYMLDRWKNQSNQTSYTYNDHGQMSSMTDRRYSSLSSTVVEVTSAWTYDALGRTTTQTQDGVTLQYDYDKNGNITELEQPTDGDSTSTEVTSYVYDGYGQLESIYQNSEKVTDYIYNTKGQLDETKDYLKFDEGNTTTVMATEYTYTGLGEVSQIRYSNDSTNATLERYSYTYNKRGYIESETLVNTYDGTTTQTKTHVYDSLGRLKQTTTSDDIDDIIKYSYDNVGNRYQEKYYVNGVSCYKILTYYYNEFDQLTEITEVGSTNAQSIATYEYDDRGALVSKEERLYNGIVWNDDGTWEYIYSPWPPWYETTYTYDKAGNLQKTAEEKSAGTVIKGHFYNGMGQRIRREEDSNTTKYVYTGSTVLFTTDDNNDKITENILAPSGQAVASQRFDGNYDGNYYFYNQDIRNSTTAIVDENFSAKKYYVYGSFGKATEKGSSSFINDITFTGAISEGDGIYYMNARFYDSNTGRLLTQDTYRGNMYEPWSQNLYTYCGNNPINYIDPTGHGPELAEIWEGTKEVVKNVVEGGGKILPFPTAPAAAEAVEAAIGGAVFPYVVVGAMCLY